VGSMLEFSALSDVHPMIEKFPLQFWMCFWTACYSINPMRSITPFWMQPSRASTKRPTLELGAVLGCWGATERNPELGITFQCSKNPKN